MPLAIPQWAVTVDGTPIPLLSASVTNGYRMAASTWQFTTSLTNVALTTSINPNGVVNITAGFAGSSGSPLVTNGLVDSVVPSFGGVEAIITVSGRDRYKQAIEYWLAPTELGGTALTIPAGTSYEAAIGLILDLALLTTGRSFDASGGTVAIDVPLQIISATDAINEIKLLNGWDVWVKQDGTIRYGNIKPFPGGVLPSLGTISPSNQYAITLSRSDDWLRNRIVVIASGSFVSVASATSPYLPTGYYKTGVFSTPNFGTSQADADLISSVALALTNRLTLIANVTVQGDPRYWQGYGVSIAEAYTGLTGNWSIYSVVHRWDRQSGYLADLVLVQ